MRKFNRTYAKKPKDLNKGELMGNGHLEQQTPQMLLVGYTIAFLAKVEVRFLVSVVWFQENRRLIIFLDYYPVFSIFKDIIWLGNTLFYE